MKRISRNQVSIEKRMDNVDNNTRYLLKYQDIAIGQVSKKVKNLEKLIKSTFIREVEEDNLKDLTEQEKIEMTITQSKKKSILNALNQQVSG